jgi:hypothetical protein
MNTVLDQPLLVLAVTLVAQGVAAYAGDLIRRLGWGPPPADSGYFNTIQAATLTLLALIIGFTFSMAVNRYDQRKNYEEAEANAIGTEYMRADLLPASDAARLRDLLSKYVDQRSAFYETYGEHQLGEAAAETARLQAELWSAVMPTAISRPTPLSALAVSGMNDVLNSQGYTQAAWWNRIPPGAWCLMAAVAICSNVLIGYDSHRARRLSERNLLNLVG